MAYDRRGYAGAATATTLNGGITAGSTTLTLNGFTGWPDGSSSRKFAIVIDRGLASEEKILCSARTGATVTVDTRGYDSTSAQSHSNGANVEHVITSVDMDEGNATAAGTLGLVTTKGDVLLATGSNTFVRAAAPSNDRLRISDSSQTNGWTTWAVPLGILGAASVTTDQAGIGTSFTDLTNLSIAVTAKTSRTLMVTASVPFLKSTADELELFIREGSTVLDSVRRTYANNEISSLYIATILTAVSGAHTYKLTARCDTGTATLDVSSGAETRKAWIIVQDVGV